MASGLQLKHGIKCRLLWMTENSNIKFEQEKLRNLKYAWHVKRPFN